MSTLGTANVARLDLDMPTYAGWWADVILTMGTLPAIGGRLTLSVGPPSSTASPLSLLGTVTFADFDSPDVPHVVVVGGAGWDAPLAARSYSSDAGVRLATVLSDLSTDTGETYQVQPPDRSIGALYDRPGSAPGAPVVGRRVLLDLWRENVIPPWWMHGDGTTRFGVRPGGASSGRADVTERDASVRLKIVGIDSPAGFLPGVTLEGSVIRRIRVRETGGALTMAAWT